MIHRSAKIVVHWSLLRKFHFVDHPKIMHCSKANAEYKNMHAQLCTLLLHACKYRSRSAKIIVSIHYTILSHFNFLHHPQILFSSKSNVKYRNLHVHICKLHLHACTYCSRSTKIIVSIHWFILSNFNFLNHPKIMHCLKAIAKYRSVHAHFCALPWHACTYEADLI